MIENEIRTFDITIFDVEQASNSLSRIYKFKNQLGTEYIGMLRPEKGSKTQGSYLFE